MVNSDDDDDEEFPRVIVYAMLISQFRAIVGTQHTINILGLLASVEEYGQLYL